MTAGSGVTAGWLAKLRSAVKEVVEAPSSPWAVVSLSMTLADVSQLDSRPGLQALVGLKASCNQPKAMLHP